MRNKSQKAEQRGRGSEEVKLNRVFSLAKHILEGSASGRSVLISSMRRWAESDLLVAQTVKNLPAMRETWIWSLGWEDPLEEGRATHSSILAWRIPVDRGAWWATVHGVAELYKTEWLNTVMSWTKVLCINLQSDRGTGSSEAGYFIWL